MKKDNLFSLVLAYEKAGLEREAIRQLTAGELKEIDKNRKGVREDILKQIKGLNDCKAAVTACNAISQSQKGVDNAEKQRLSRRRTLLRGCLSKAYPEYDFGNVTTRRGGVASTKIEATYIGSAERREAIDLMASIDRLRKLGLVKLPKLDIDTVTASIESESSATIETPTEHMLDIAPYLSSISSTIEGIQERAKLAQSNS